MAGDPLKYRIKFFIMTLLAIKPSHGYEILRRIEEVTGGIIKVSPGSLYPLLKEMLSEGLVEEETIIEGGRIRKVYRLTDKGYKEAAKSLEAAEYIMGSLLRLVTQAREKLKEAMEEGLEPCPSHEIIRGLEDVKASIDAYLGMLKKRMESCRASREA